MTLATEPNGALLPELRQDLQLHPGPIGGREASWLIYDPVRHRYFEVSLIAFELLQMWRSEPIDKFARRAENELERSVAIDHVKEIATFIIANNLAQQPARDDALSLARQETRAHHSLIWRLVHNYLFFKIPLIRPERFLNSTMHIVTPLYTRAAAVVVLMMWLAGLYFASRQWDQFVTTFFDLFGLQGAVTFAIALIGVKSLHELGHAFTATRLGVRVHTMGVAFMVMTPVLYTDVTDAWRLRRRRDKLSVDAAGIVVELALAGIAIFFWAFLPDGPLRSVMFVMATTSLFMGLAVNLNPLMRFDGYHLLADAWRIPNLQSRSNDLAIWRLREFLFGLGQPPPETFPARQRSLLIFYAVCVWIYRLSLFIGIALVVYHMFFKVLGIVLFAVEVIWFIVLPIAREIKAWWMMRSLIVESLKCILTGAVAAGGLAVLFVPWSGTVVIQGVALSASESVIYAPRQGRVVSIDVTENTPVKLGQTLMVLAAPELEHELRQTKKQIDLVQIRLDRIAGDEADRSQRAVLQSEFARHEAHVKGLEQELKKFVVGAAFDGIIRDVDRDLRATEWIDDSTPIARLVDGKSAQLKGYVSEDDIWRIDVGSSVDFIPEDPAMWSRHGHVSEIVQTAVRTIDLHYLASIYGGAVTVDRNAEGELKPRSGKHLVRVAVEGPAVARAIRGTLHISGKAESFASAIWRRVLQVLVRESSA